MMDVPAHHMTEFDKHVSRYDPSRMTVGKIYQDIQMRGPKDPILVGDMSNELVRSCIEDLNCALRSDPYGSLPFYVMIHEKKDLQMKSAILRRVIKLPFRPWPEDDTVVFWTDPKTAELRFCWALPHWSEMDNLLMNPIGYSEEMIRQVKAWKDFNMHEFGFVHEGKDPRIGWKVDSTIFQDRRLG